MGKCNVSLQVAIIYTSDDCLTKYFVYLSGEQTSVGKAEVNALAGLLEIDVSVRWDGRMGLIESKKNPVPFFLERAALVKEAGIVFSEIDVQGDLLGNLPDDLLTNTIRPEETFSVRTMSENGMFSVKERLDLEANLGARIKQATGAKVNLENPQVRILVVFTQGSIRVCKSIASKLRPMLRDREPGRKPFFHPSMMNASLARVMCNLAGVMPGEVVLDPFCGGGGILCEASLIGAKSIGIDLNWRLLMGSKKNLDSTGSDYSVIQGDIRSLSVHECDCIVTDPPYGRASSTRGAQAIELVESLFERADSILRRRKESICVCGSSEMNIQNLAESMGLMVNQVLQIKVHSGLVRELLTLGF
ncbi:MAG: tRNA (guanine(10)-N2)-dimethyltransferase [Candidatus Thorarchaeota archaeon AB_25]|nr:MAG: tRNA (guanine(10)-N2)-dimethyltransferase [Candidatus Thorarchaeota archaeon AB_25]